MPIVLHMVQNSNSDSCYCCKYHRPQGLYISYAKNSKPFLRTSGFGGPPQYVQQVRRRVLMMCPPFSSLPAVSRYKLFPYPRFSRKCSRECRGILPCRSADDSLCLETCGKRHRRTDGQTDRPTSRYSICYAKQ